MKKQRKKVQYANPILQVVRKRSTMLAVQLQGEDSIDVLTGLYLTVVGPSAFGGEDSFQLLKFDLDMGVLWFQPTEHPLEMTVGDWLVYDGDQLAVVHDSMFQANYRITIRGNKKEKNVRRKEGIKGRLSRVRDELAEGYNWFVQ